MVPEATASAQFCQAFGGAVFIAIDILAKDDVGVQGKIFINSGANQFHSVSEGSSRLHALNSVLTAYMTGPRHAYYASVACAGCAFLAVLGLEWRSVKKGPGGENDAAAATLVHV
ncbi:hypothetical protein E4U54_005984 [Claviceps lovelessii]|nr:hypothetical protein E4U54_005984 [Claviceps lovelessii]